MELLLIALARHCKACFILILVNTCVLECVEIRIVLSVYDKALTCLNRVVYDSCSLVGRLYFAFIRNIVGDCSHLNRCAASTVLALAFKACGSNEKDGKALVYAFAACTVLFKDVEQSVYICV